MRGIAEQYTFDVFLDQRKYYIIYVIIIIDWMTALSASEKYKSIGQLCLCVVVRRTYNSFLMATIQNDSEDRSATVEIENDGKKYEALKATLTSATIFEISLLLAQFVVCRWCETLWLVFHFICSLHHWLLTSPRLTWKLINSKSVLENHF